MSEGWIDEVKAHGLGATARALGLEVKEKANGLEISPCPSCHAEKRHTKSKDKRSSIGAKNGGWKCFQCDATGDALNLVSWMKLERPQPSTKEEWNKIKGECASLGLCSGNQGGVFRRPSRPVVVSPPPKTVFNRPPLLELENLWSHSFPLDAVPSNEMEARWIQEARAYLTGRGYECSTLAKLDVARVLPHPQGYKRPEWLVGGSSHRVFVRAFEANGAFGSVHVRAINATQPKSLWPKGVDCAELVFANTEAREILQGRQVASKVLIAEGLTDFLRACEWSQEAPMAVFGIESGSAKAFSRIQFKKETLFWIGTDNDETGEKYFQEISNRLPRDLTKKPFRLLMGETER